MCVYNYVNVHASKRCVTISVWEQHCFKNTLHSWKLFELPYTVQYLSNPKPSQPLNPHTLALTALRPDRLLLD